ncbi:MAG: hypothetical protein SH817_14790 [Leptospira sp.]|nr:hypothetical protein [Leptospira sp.]
MPWAKIGTKGPVGSQPMRPHFRWEGTFFAEPKKDRGGKTIQRNGNEDRNAGVRTFEHGLRGARVNLDC